MEPKVLLATSFQVLLSWVVTCGSPLSFSSSSSPSSSSSSISFSIDSASGPSLCEPVEIGVCGRVYSSVQMPNVYGDFSQRLAAEKLDNVLSSFTQENSALMTFFCTLYLPPCAQNFEGIHESSKGGQVTLLPCRNMCELAMNEGRGLLNNGDHSWPLKCQTLPTENCFNFDGARSVTFVRRSINATPTKTPYNDVISFAPLEVELGNDEGYEVEVVSLSNSQIPERRYDIADLGDPSFFQGWADVQATGAANDYCRVIGKGKRRFLSCNLAGSTGQGHHYVSKLSFDAGYPNTWFMRDMDGDGRDDYCRCVGPKSSSKMTCMKAGEKGFYGSTTQGGNQHTFSLPASDGCHNRRVNPLFGEKAS